MVNLLGARNATTRNEVDQTLLSERLYDALAECSKLQYDDMIATVGICAVGLESNEGTQVTFMGDGTRVRGKFVGVMLNTVSAVRDLMSSREFTSSAPRLCAVIDTPRFFSDRDEDVEESRVRYTRAFIPIDPKNIVKVTYGGHEVDQ